MYGRQEYWSQLLKEIGWLLYSSFRERGYVALQWECLLVCPILKIGEIEKQGKTR